MTKNIATACFFVVLSVSSVGAAVADRVALDVKLCRPAPSVLLQPLDIGWQEFGRYIHLCPIFGKEHTLVLYVMTPRLDLAGRDWPFSENFNEKGHGIDRKSFILDANEKIIGELPSSFPFDPPDTLDITFTNWHGGFPFRIESYYHANSLHGPERGDPLFWNAHVGKFQDSPP